MKPYKDYTYVHTYIHTYSHIHYHIHTRILIYTVACVIIQLCFQQVRIVARDEIDVEGLEEMDISSGIRVGEGEIDQLMQDLQNSSSSEEEYEKKEESDIDDV